MQQDQYLLFEILMQMFVQFEQLVGAPVIQILSANGIVGVSYSV